MLDGSELVSQVPHPHVARIDNFDFKLAGKNVSYFAGLAQSIPDLLASHRTPLPIRRQ